MQKTRQLALKRTNGWGGRRRGSGRPRVGTEVSHARRLEIGPNVPVHITMRLRPLAVSLRSKRMLRAFQSAAKGAAKFGLRLNQFSLMGNHLHFIAEADGNQALARGMRSFGGRLGKSIRAAAGGRGAVFNGRFHLHALKTPTEYRRALGYVLLNHSKHAKLEPRVDSYSSAPYFKDWSRLVHPNHARRMAQSCIGGPLSFLDAARSWVGRLGWWRGRAIDFA